MDEKSSYPPDMPRSAAQYAEPMAMRERPRFTPERTRELMTLAQSIAATVVTAGIQGRERCKLRAMVEMFLDE